MDAAPLFLVLQEGVSGNYLTNQEVWGVADGMSQVYDYEVALLQIQFYIGTNSFK